MPQAVEIWPVPSPKVNIRGLVSFQLRCTYLNEAGEEHTVFSKEFVLTEQNKHIQNDTLADLPKVTIYEGEKGVLVDAFL